MNIGRRRAFTLVEVIIVIAVVVVVGVIIFTNLLGGKSQADLNNTTSQVVASIRQAESQSMAQSQNATWGIHFANVTSTAPYYAIFTGPSYASGTVQSRYPLPPTIGYVTSTLPLGSSTDITFSGITGAASASTSVSLYLISNPSDQENITISSLGEVSYTSCTGNLGNWQTTTPLPIVTFNQPGVVSNGYAYLMGNGVTYYAPISGNGAFGSWATTTPLLSVTSYQVAVADNGYIYALGGSVATSTVYYAQISSNGTLGSWATTTPLLSGISGQAVIANNGYIYSLAGSDVNSVATSTVYYTQVLSNGTLGSWATTTPLLSGIFNAPSAVVNNGYVYLMGQGPAPVMDSDYYAKISSNGTIGPWSNTTVLPLTIMQPLVVNNGYIYSMADSYATGFTLTSTVYYAPISGNGTLGSWSITAILPAALDDQSFVANNGYIYSIGGTNSNGATSTIYYASLCH